MNVPFRSPKLKKSNVWQITIGKEKDRWRWEVELVRKDGTSFRKSGTRKTEKDAIKARDDAFKKFNETGGKGGKQYTVKTWCQYCLDGGMTTQSKKTLHHYRGWLESRVYPTIGPIKLEELRADTLKELYQHLQANDVASCAVRLRTALNACLTLAVEEGRITQHVGRIAKLRKVERSGPDTFEDEAPGKRLLSADEEQRLLDCARSTDLYWIVFFGIRFGLRIGECLGLFWSDIDLDSQSVKVRRQSQRIPGEGKQFTDLKTGNSRRSIPIPDKYIEELKLGKAQAEEKGQMLVSPNLVGRQSIPQDISPKFKALIKRAGITGPIDCTHHDLRSTLLTYLANNANDGRGVPPSMLRAIAGHGKIDTTYRYYIQAEEADVRKAMNFVR